ncbi:MAG: hypothetical protein Q4C42_11700 [Clostridia bacterium]|nr:hypothetical protein [Clostridia bacterium]
MPSPENFRKIITAFGIEQDIIDEIYSGYEDLKDKSDRKIKSEFFAHALSVMNEKLPPDRVREILEANACCKSGTRLKNSKQFAKENKDKSLEEKLELISSQPQLNMGSAELDEKNNLLIHAVSYKSDEKFECACPTVSRVKHTQPIPKEYCYCCAGHFSFHYELMLGVKLKEVEIVSSPHEDENYPCVFRFEIEN